MQKGRNRALYHQERMPSAYTCESLCRVMGGWVSNRYYAVRVLLPISSELLNSSTIQERTVLAIRQSKRRRAPDAPKDVRRHDTPDLPGLRVRP